MMMENIQNIFQYYEGTHIFKANSIIIEKLKDLKSLLSNGKLTHSYPHSSEIKSTIGA